MIKTVDDPLHKAFSMLVQATVKSAECTSGFLIGRERGQWRFLCGYGANQTPPAELPDESWLLKTFNDRDVTIVNDALGETAPALFYGFRALGQAFLVGVAIRDQHSALVGVVFLSGEHELQKLSAAQTYALQSHAAIISEVFQARSSTRPQVNHPAMERLRLLESVVVNAKDAILITEAEPIDLPGPRIVYCNPAFVATTGYSPADVIGQTPRILQCKDSNRKVLDQIRASLAQWQPIEVELINARKDGSQFWVQLSIVPVANEKGWFTHWVSVQRDITERKEAESLLRQARATRDEKIALETRLLERERIEQELSYAAFHDSLTSLYNRAYLMSRLLAMFTENGQGRTPGATVLFLDLDRFKFVNDSLGHRAGDLLLKVVAQRLQQCAGEGAVFARVGGDEFAILLLGASHAERAVPLARQIVDSLSLPVVIDGNDIFTSCSIGIVSADTTHVSPEDILRDADVAMYAAKKQGRGLWAIFDASMRKAAVDALQMQIAIKQAVARQEFQVVYQPIYHVISGEISGVEALVRWLNPILGHVPPDVFVGVAEENGVIHELGAWVMSRACSDLQGWKKEFPGLTLHLNVNVSGYELNRAGYAEQVAHILEQTGTAPRDLQIEITESVFLHEPDAVAKVLATIRSVGVRVALDDFGTGYSSLGYIDRYPIDAIKIDRSFVSRMMSFERSEAIVESILSLGRALDVAITAEGVETLAQLQLLKNMRCPYVQGFLLSPPVHADEVTTLLQSWAVK
jgi:diguanylate cyclase (GGDEF)-like protein/PAS domain S-box-containing protein